MLRTALRNILTHKARLLMTLLAVMLGVAFVSGSLVFTDTLANAYRNQAAKGYAHVDVEVRAYASGSGENPGLSRKALDEIAGLDGVAEAAGRVYGDASVADKDGRLLGSALSNAGANFAPGKDGKDGLYVFPDGSGPTEAGQVALDKASAAQGGYHVGDTVRVATKGPAKTYTLSGIFTTEDSAVADGGSLVLFDTPVAQRLYLKPGRYQTVTVTAAPGASNTELAATIGKLLPDYAEAQTGRQLANREADLAEADASNLNSMLLAFAAVALVVSVFLIANTFTMLAAQRTRELALLRAVGASRKQVTRSVLAEAMVLGALASVAGLALGAGATVVLRSTIGGLGGELPDGPVTVTSTTVIVAFAVGVLVTMLAAWLPARRAAKIPPVAAMSSVHLPATTKSLVLRNSLGGLLTLLGVAVSVQGGRAGGSGGGALVGLGAILALAGVMLLIPLLSRPAVAAVRPLLRAVGIEGTLAGQNAVRNPRRTGATASALTIGLTLVTALTMLGVTLGQAVDKMTTDIVKADYMVTAVGGSGLDASAVAALRKAEGVNAVSQEQPASMRLGGSLQPVSGVTPADFQRAIHLTTVSGSLGTFARGQIAVADDIARSNGWKTGDSVPVTYDDAKSGKLTVGAVFERNTVVSPVVVSTDVLEPHEAESVISRIYVKTDGGESAANKRAVVDALAGNPAIEIGDRQDIRAEFGGFISTALNVMYGLLAMSLVIAVLGIVNTLAMSVFERQREIGMLRATGLDRRRVKRMIRLEAVVISVFGAAIGLGLGAFLGWAVGETVASSVPGYALVLPWGRFALSLLLAALVGTLAAMWPARSAARLNMLTAIKSE
ncbi:FtsX-like permease family protein [Streptomyces coeruleorubidus]|uniref:ABC transporter permease n=1 Tax=Streptomyces coeruleorubidus TaxID=116188 RepID=UPI00237F9D82|nr:FtsX-like permease family protein [Streptomyces coeruleorubidus]WDV56549.1 FtsX-like permease family protein [Streptomyces coeruleorubidus]